jgi:hypothetical protein
VHDGQCLNLVGDRSDAAKLRCWLAGGLLCSYRVWYGNLQGSTCPGPRIGRSSSTGTRVVMRACMSCNRYSAVDACCWGCARIVFQGLHHCLCTHFNDSTPSVLSVKLHQACHAAAVAAPCFLVADHFHCWPSVLVLPCSQCICYLSCMCCSHYASCCSAAPRIGCGVHPMRGAALSEGCLPV